MKLTVTEQRRVIRELRQINTLLADNAALLRAIHASKTGQPFGGPCRKEASS